MLALTYPDGARVHRCDYLPEKSAISSGGDFRLADRRKRRERRCSRSERRRNHHDDDEEDEEDEEEDEDGRKELSGLTSDQFLPVRDCLFDAEVREGTESSQSTTRISNSEEISRLDEVRQVEVDVESDQIRRRRRELPGRESWPGGRHPKDRCFLNLILIILLITLGSDRNWTNFSGIRGLVAFGGLLGGAFSAPIDIDAGVRSERSANLSHITGASRKIQMYVKNRHLQILPDGTVNGSSDDTSDFTVLQRTSVSRGQLRIQGVATCLYLCMDSCGLLYGSREYTEECVFNETLESHNYNTYSSAHWSTPKKTLYLGLTGQGQPRRVQARGHILGRLSAYARVLPQVVAQDRVEALHRRMMGAKHNVRHHHGSQQILCPALAPQEKDGRDKFRCRKRKKRKKRRRKCKTGELPGPQCDAREAGVEAQSKRSCEGAALDEACRKEALETPAKKRKSRIGDEDDDVDEDLSVEDKSRRSNPARRRGKKSTTASSPTTQSPKKSARKKKNQHQHQHQQNGNKNKKKARSARTTRTLPTTSPIAWYPQTTRATLLQDPEPLSSTSSGSSVSAVSFAATLSFTVGRMASDYLTNEDTTTVVNDIDELVRTRGEQQDEAKDFEDDEEDEEDEDEDEEIRLAM